MFWQHFYPSPILLDLNFLQIHWYGFFVTLSILTGFFIFKKLVEAYCNTSLHKTVFKKTEIFNLFFYLIIFGLIGARLYHCLSEFNYYWYNPLKIFYLWQGGLGIYGGLIAGIIIVYFFAKNLSGKNNQQPPVINHQLPIIFLTILDLLSPAIALGQAIGRWGNYFNQELYGLPTNSFLGLAIAPANRLPGFENFDLFQPLFFYESLFCFGLFIILFLSIVYPERSQACLPVGKGSRLSHKIPGTIFLLYLFLYSFWRFIIEFFRIDPQPIFLNLRLGQWTSLTLIIICLVFYILIKKWYNNSCHPE